MKTIEKLALILLGLGLAGSGIYQENRANTAERKLRLERGDEVEIVLQNKTEIEANLFQDCKITYLDGIALQESNVVFLRLANCSHSFFRGKDYVEVRPRETIRKKELAP